MKKIFFIISALTWVVYLGCSKENTQKLDIDGKSNIAENIKHLTNTQRGVLLNSSTYENPFTNYNLDLYPTSTGYYAQVSFTYDVPPSTYTKPATLCFSYGSQNFCSSIIVSPGVNVQGVNISDLQHGNTIEAKISIMFESGVTSTFSLGKVYVYLPIYESTLKIQGLPEDVKCLVNYSYSSGFPRWQNVYANFNWPEEYRSKTKKYVFVVEIGNYASGVFNVLYSFSGKAYPSDGFCYVGGAIFYDQPFLSPPTNFHYRLSVYEDGLIYSPYNNPKIPSSSSFLNVNPEHTVRVFKSNASGFLYE